MQQVLGEPLGQPLAGEACEVGQEPAAAAAAAAAEVVLGIEEEGWHRDASECEWWRVDPLHGISRPKRVSSRQFKAMWEGQEKLTRTEQREGRKPCVFSAIFFSRIAN